MCRVHPGGVVVARENSQLALAQVRLAADGVVSLGNPACDELLFVFAGGGNLDGELLESGSAGLVVAGESIALTAGPDGLSSVRASIGAEVDLHATSKLREEHKAAFKKAGVGLTFLSFICAAIFNAPARAAFRSSRPGG